MGSCFIPENPAVWMFPCSTDTAFLKSVCVNYFTDIFQSCKHIKILKEKKKPPGAATTALFLYSFWALL